MTLDSVGTTVVFIFGSLAIAVCLLGLVFAIRQVLRDENLSDLAKTIWVVLLIATPILGLVAWFIFGLRRRPATLEPRGHR